MSTSENGYGITQAPRAERGRPGIEKVISGDYCVGCGGCAAVSAKRIAMSLDANAIYQPEIGACGLTEEIAAATRAVCPFLDDGPHENQFGATFAQDGSQYSEKLGWYRSLLAGHSVEGEFRSHGSSGGITSWLINELQAQGHIDAAIEVGAKAADTPRFGYSVADDKEAIHHHAKTRYYPVEISRVAELVRDRPARYAFVGVPCVVKAMRRVAEVDPVIKERITFYVAIVCGHMKSGRFGESLAWQMGVQAEEIESMDFRRKIPDRPASRYGFAVKPRDLAERVAPMSELAGHDWGMGMFRLKACDYCDDVVGETADVSFGDAWLPRFAKDSAGTNIVIARSDLATRLLSEGRERSALEISEISEADVIRSQDASFRHRRDGLAYRLWLDDRSGRWRPLKRTQASRRSLNAMQKIIMRFRANISARSHSAYREALERQNIGHYLRFVDRAARVNKLLGGLSKRYARVLRKLRLS